MARANRFRGKERWLRGLRQLKSEVRLEIEKATEANARDMEKTAKAFAQGSRQTGDLINSIKATGERDGPAIRWRVTAGDEKAFYARMVEFGTAPGGTPPVSGKRRKAAAVRGGTHPGTTARPYFFPAYRALRKRLKGRLSRGLGRAKRKVFPK